MTLKEFVQQNPSFATEGIGNQVLAIAWYWRTYEPDRVLQFNELVQAFKDIALDSTQLLETWNTLISQEPKALVMTTLNEYQIALPFRLNLDQKYATSQGRPQSAAVKKLLTDLLATIPDTEQRIYLDETIICLKNEAYRAAIIMAWNLGYDHLCRYILQDQGRLDDFNKHVVKNKVTLLIDFADSKESQVLQWSRAANIIEKHTLLLLEAALDRRNMAAHPSSTSQSLSNVESIIDDVVKQVIHKYPLR
jgi:hypothetical protein